MAPLGGPGTLWAWLEGRDVAGAPDGDLVVTLSRLSWPTLAPYQYLVRLSTGGCTILAYHSLWLLPDQDARAVAVGSDGTMYASFQTDSFDPTDSLFAFAPEFPAGGTDAVQPLYSPIGEVSWLAVDPSNRVYVPRPARSPNPAQVAVLSPAQTNAVLVSLQHRLLADPQDLAIDADGNLYVVCTELRSFDGSFRTVARVVRYPAATRMDAGLSVEPAFETVSAHVHPFGGLRLSLRASAGCAYEIQATEDLANAFRAVDAVKALGDGVEWFDTGFGAGTPPDTVPSRFYRVDHTGPDVIPP